MFNTLTNDVKLVFVLHTNSPLAIRSGENNPLDPTLPKMQCLRTRYQGIDTVFMPGSSLKGVFRSHSERIISLFGGKTCPIPDRQNRCKDANKKGKNGNTDLTAQEIYEKMCVACRMFGSTSIGSKVRFKDAYPIKDSSPIIGMRNGVGINRITGAAQDGAIYDFEVVEEGLFQVEITLHNYELYQLKLLLYVIQDIQDGYVAFGGGTSRGNGKMLVENLSITFRDYRKDPKKLMGYDGESDSASLLQFDKKDFYYESKMDTIDEVFTILKNVDMGEKMLVKKR